MSGSINKILNDALDQTILNETELTEVTGQADADRAAANTAKEMAASALARQQLKKAAAGPDTGGGMIPGPDYAKYGKYGLYGLGGIGAGIGAVMLAKKLRAKKKAADAKKAKK